MNLCHHQRNMKTNLAIPERTGAEQQRRRPAAFTLIELLVVIAIIGMLAALTLNLMPAIQEKKIRSAVRVEMNGLTTAIGAYHAKKYSYPPDNPNNPAQPPLAYELTGTMRTGTDPNNPIYQTTFGSQAAPETLTAAQVQNLFGIPGFLNAAPPSEPEEAVNFFKSLKPERTQLLNGGARVIVTPYRAPNGDYVPWSYNSSNPTNNPGSYDLWAEVTFGGKTIIIGNWTE